MRSLVPLLLTILLTCCGAFAGPTGSSEVFYPDVYPSPSSAASGLARRAAATLLAAPRFQQDEASVDVRGDADAQILTEFSRALGEELPKLKVRMNPGQSSPASARATVQAALVCHEGKIILTVAGDGIQQTFSARFVDKPWADDWDAYIRTQLKGRWIKGESKEFAASESKALDQAREAASAKLWPRVRDRMNERNRSRPSAILVREPWVRGKLESLLRQDKYVHDTFVQEFERPYGTVWKASILIDASASTIDEMAQYCARLARAEFGSKAVTAGSMAGMIGVIVLLYFFINAVTKGYFVWRLRALALLLGIVGILMVLAVR